MPTRGNRYPVKDEEDKLVECLARAGWRTGKASDTEAQLVRCGDLIQPRDAAAAIALYQAQVGAPVNIRGEPPKEIWFVHVADDGEYYFDKKPRDRRDALAPKTFPIERTARGEGFVVERALVEPRGSGWVAAADGNNIWLRRRQTTRRQ
jgi:hypothetical protein